MTRFDSRLTFALLATTTLCGPMMPLSAQAQTLPTGGNVPYGNVAIGAPNANGTALAIQQSSSAAIVNWQGFSIGQGNRVDISQPNASSTLLNRVTGSTPSSIAGQLNANGQVYLVNPNGIAITPTGVVKAGGGFVASTLDMNDDDFKSGRRIFTGNGRSAGVSNAGSIEVGQGGYAALIGGQVDNSGTIAVPMGRVGLGAGERATLDVSGDGFLQVTVPSSNSGDGAALIRHSGRIQADGGRVEMQAATLRQAARETINLSGIVEAKTIGGRSGAIVLGGGDGGRVRVSGRLDASAPSPRPSAAPRGTVRGGTITLKGDDIALTGASLDASGPDGGGQIRVGGDYQGGGTLQRASTTSVDSATTIRADATANGDGGSVVLWSDQMTSFAGLISAKGGPEGGNGGSAEVSGKQLLAYSGLTDLSATSGAFGTLLLDPFNVTISTNPDTAGNAVAAGTNFATPIGPVNGTQFSPNSNDSNINTTTLQNALATANVNVTTGTAGTQQGNISVLSSIAWTSPTILGLQAAGGIIINAPISAARGSLGLQSATGVNVNAPLTFTAGSIGLITLGSTAFNADVTAGGTLFIRSGNTTGANLAVLPAIGAVTATGAINVGTFTLDRGNWVQNSANLPAFSANIFTITPGTATFRRVQGGDGSVANPFLIADVYGLQGIGTSTSFLSNSYALAGNIDASGTASWNSGAGFTPIGSTSPFTGSFDGRNQTIGGLTINRPGTNGVGLFGTVQNATIQNLNLTQLQVTGASNVGGLIGAVSVTNLSGSTQISGVNASGRVSGTTSVGGLIGSVTVNNDRALIGARSTSVAVTGSSSAVQVGGTNSVGGLIGQVNVNNDDSSSAAVSSSVTVTQSRASGAVTGTGQDVGGLIGNIVVNNFAPIFPDSSAGVTVGNSSATGAVSGGSNVGGLVGSIFADGTRGTATTTLSFATGAVTGTGSNVGGLIGLVDLSGARSTLSSGGGASNVSQTYATGAVNGTGAGSSGVGGLIGSNAGSVSDSFATGSASGNSNVGGLVGSQNGGSIARSFAIGRVSGSSGAGGLIGASGGSPNITDSYFDSQTTGQSSSAGGTGQTTAQLQSGLPAGFSSSTYGSGIGGALSYPFLLNLPIPDSISSSTSQPTAPSNQNNLAIATSSPTLSRQLPFTFATLNANQAIIDLTLGGGSGGGPTIGTGQGSGSTTRQSAAQTLTFVQRASNDLERRLAACDGRGGSAYKDCVGGALQQYASALDSQILQLPPPLRAVTAVIREAARRVQAVATVAEARTIVRAAVTEVRRAISLLRADEPAVARLQVRQGNAIASALQSVNTKLARAVGL